MQLDTEQRQAFLSFAQSLKDQGKLTPGKLAEKDPKSKLNLVFDIDHTLIFALDKKVYPKLAEEHGMEWGKNLHTLSLQGGFEMWLVVRFGVKEMLDYLSTFCTFYVYSHGLHHYISQILNLIDPEGKYFKYRDTRMIAPRDPKEQMQYTNHSKWLTDFRDPADRQKPLFSEEDLKQSLIIDDQYAAIRDKDHLVMSKKFLKYAEQVPYANAQKREHWRNYQYPNIRGRQPFCLVMNGDMSKAHWETNDEGSSNQLFHICNLITRCYLAKTLLQPEKGINEILQEYKKSIFKGQRFYFEDFLTVGHPGPQIFTQQELYSAKQIEEACKALVIELGGLVVTQKMTAGIVVLHQLEAKQDQLSRYRADQKVVNFRYITECYFKMLRLKFTSVKDGSFLVTPKK